LVVAIPTPQEDDDVEEDACLTASDSKDPGKECVFPFKYENVTYFGCPMDPEDATRRWCSTKTDENGVHVTGSFGYCTKGCKPEISADELSVGTNATETQAKICDYTACNKYTLKTSVFGNEVTFGQCQFPAPGTKDKYFCFVNADSACPDKVPYGDEKEGLYLTTLACKDPNAPLPRFFGLFDGFAFSSGWFGPSRSSFGLFGSRSFTSNVDFHENKKKVEIEIKFTGHKFKEENLNIRVTKRNRLIVKVEDDEEIFRLPRYELPENALVDKIESKFDNKKEKVQTIIITVPKDATNPIGDEDYYYLY